MPVFCIHYNPEDVLTRLHKSEDEDKTCLGGQPLATCATIFCLVHVDEPHWDTFTEAYHCSCINTLCFQLTSSEDDCILNKIETS